MQNNATTKSIDALNLEAIYEIMGVGVLIQGVDGLIRFANQAACTILCLTQDQLLGKDSRDPHWEMYGEDGQPIAGENHPSMITLRTGKACHNQVVQLYAHNPKQRRWLLVNTEPIYPTEEAPIAAVIVTFNDITESKKQAAALSQKLKKLTNPSVSLESLSFEEIFDIAEIQKIQDAFSSATCVASIITDTKGEPITQASNFCCLCEKVIRKTDLGLANCKRSDAHLGRPNRSGPVMQPCLSGGLWDGGASIFVGDRHIANWLIGQVRNDALDTEKMMEYAQIIGADKQEFRRALEEVPVMSTVQFERVCVALFQFAKQLSQLAYQNLQQARMLEEGKQAEEERRHLEQQVQHSQKLESLGVLAGGIAHDFNNLLMAIMGNTELALTHQPPDSPAQQHLHDVLKSSRAAAGLCQQMLLYAGRSEIKKTRLNLDELVQEMGELLKVSISKRATLSIFHPQEHATILGDATQLRQVIMNLITNASEAVHEKGGNIYVQSGVRHCDRSYLHSSYMKNSLEAGPYAFLEVADTGHGMDQRTKERLFEPFFSTKFAGRGLGMAAVLGILQRHEGTIILESEKEHGACFVVLFPLCADQQEAPHQRVQKASLFKGTGHVLLVDDEISVRSVGSRLLKHLGFSVSTAADGQEGLDLFVKNPQQFRIILLDLTMPRLDGLETYKAIREINTTIPILLCSGYTRQQATLPPKKDTALAFIQKPYRAQELSEKLHKLLD